MSSQNAFDVLKTRFEGMGLRIDYSEVKKGSVLFVGNMDPSVQESVHEAVKRLPGVAGEVHCRSSLSRQPRRWNDANHFWHDIDRNLKGELRPYLHVPFENEEAAQIGMAQLLREVDPQKVHIEYAKGTPRESRNSKPEYPDRPPTISLFVGNIPFGATEQDIVDVFKYLPGFIRASPGTLFCFLKLPTLG